jgi:hypothetical protein
MNFVGIWGLLFRLATLAAGPLNPNDVSVAVSAFGFFSGFLTYILTSIVTRKAYIRIQRKVAVVIAAQGASIFLGIMDLVTHATIFGWSNLLFKLGLITWAGSLVPMYILIGRVISIDRVRFPKPTNRFQVRLPWHKQQVTFPPFSSFQKLKDGKTRLFGVGCIDYYLKQATDTSQNLFFPILLVAEKHFRPWRICSRFAAAGMKESESVIYFGFNQPVDIIVEQLAKQLAFLNGSSSEWRAWWTPERIETWRKKFEHLYVIDCNSSWIGGRSKAASRESLESPVKEFLPSVRKRMLRSDPRDVIGLSACYDKALRRAIREMIRDEGVFVRVVYDSISDLLQYSDPQLAMQFIKHNMVWEDKNNANSLYLYIPDVPQANPSNPVDEAFLRWNAYCEINFKCEDSEKERILIDDLFLKREEGYISMQDNDYVLKT